MKRIGKLFIVVFVAFILQTSVFTKLRMSSTQPDILSVMLACLSAFTGTYGSFCAGSISGLLMNASVGHVMALYIVLYPLMGYGSAKMRPAFTFVFKRLLKGKIAFTLKYVVNIVICILIVALRESVFVVYMFLNGVEISYLHIIRVLQCIVYSAVLTIPAYLIIQRFLSSKNVKSEDGLSGLTK